MAVAGNFEHIIREVFRIDSTRTSFIAVCGCSERSRPVQRVTCPAAQSGPARHPAASASRPAPNPTATPGLRAHVRLGGGDLGRLYNLHTCPTLLPFSCRPRRVPPHTKPSLPISYFPSVINSSLNDCARLASRSCARCPGPHNGLFAPDIENTAYRLRFSRISCCRCQYLC